MRQTSTKARSVRAYKTVSKLTLGLCMGFAITNAVAFLEVPALETSVAEWHSAKYPSIPLAISILDRPVWVFLAWGVPWVASDIMRPIHRARMIGTGLEHPM